MINKTEINMDIIISILFLTVGALAIFFPDSLCNVAALKPEQVARNRRIWKRCGFALILLGAAGLIIVLLRH
jgi:hypothetical protein